MRALDWLLRIAAISLPAWCLAADPAADALAVLSRRCLSCHGPKSHLSGLDLSTRDAALKGGSKGPALRPGASSESLLMQRVQLGQMPPAAILPSAEREVLRRWIDAGAAWNTALEERRAGADWWSLQPLRAEPAPEGEASSPIDRWILAGLRRNGLAPSPAAGRRTLIRRVTFSLTGLPPAPEEISSFLADRSPSAYEKLIDRLLASPRYGEHWARHWLDVVRFSESEGFERDLLRDHSWPYRDYVIRSLNQDKPYLQFAREQIAGDVLEPVTHDGIVATGLLVAGPTDAVGLTSAVQRERDAVREDQLEEMTGVVSQTFLGLTVNCARCHDHKFDPIPQRDYYRFKAAFAGVWQPFRDPASIELMPDGRPVLTPAERERAEEQTKRLRGRAAVIEAEMERLYVEARGQTPPRSPQVPAPMARWNFDTGSRDQTGTLHAELGNKAEIHQGRLRPAGGKETATVITTPLQSNLKEKTLEAWVWVNKPAEKASPVLIVRNRSGYRGAALDGIQYTGGKAKQWENQSTARFRSADVMGPAETAAPGSRIQLAITYDSGGMIRLYRNGVPYGKAYKPDPEIPLGRLETYLAGDAVVSLTTSSSLELDEARIYGEALTESQIAASYAAGAPSVTVEDLLPALSGTRKAALSSLQTELAGIRKQLEAMPEPPKAFAADPREPPVTHVLRRGDVSLPGDAVPPAGLSSVRGVSADLGLQPDSPDAVRRSKMAAWIANPANPLFARVMVNRVWHYHFGSGIVENPNDFGFNGGRPSHPELLDWLASQFTAGGWSLKKLHKLILMSAAYQQSSKYNEQAAAKDADNRLLWRYSPHRLEGESVRDAMLAASGSLNLESGGPGFRAFTVKSLGGSYSKYEPRDSAESSLQRRTVYRMNVITGGDPLLESLDCPLPSVKTPKRPSTTTALQALSLMNNALGVRLARTFAARLERESDGVDGRIERAFHLALGRAPSEDELATSRTLVSEHKLEALCWGLFNASEFVYID